MPMEEAAPVAPPTGQVPKSPSVREQPAAPAEYMSSFPETSALGTFQMPALPTMPQPAPVAASPPAPAVKAPSASPPTMAPPAQIDPSGQPAVPQAAQAERRAEAAAPPPAAPRKVESEREFVAAPSNWQWGGTRPAADNANVGGAELTEAALAAQRRQSGATSVQCESVEAEFAPPAHWTWGFGGIVPDASSQLGTPMKQEEDELLSAQPADAVEAKPAPPGAAAPGKRRLSPEQAAALQPHVRKMHDTLEGLKKDHGTLVERMEYLRGDVATFRDEQQQIATLLEEEETLVPVS